MIKILMAALMTFSATDGFTGGYRVKHGSRFNEHTEPSHRDAGRYKSSAHQANPNFIAPPSKASDLRRRSALHHLIQQPPHTTTALVTTTTEAVAPPTRVRTSQPPKVFDRARKKKPWDTDRHAARDRKYAEKSEEHFETDRSILMDSIMSEIQSLEKRAAKLEGQSNALCDELGIRYQEINEQNAVEVILQIEKEAHELARVEERKSIAERISSLTGERAKISEQRNGVGAHLRGETEDSKSLSKKSLKAQAHELDKHLHSLDQEIGELRDHLEALRDTPIEETVFSDFYDSDEDEYSSDSLRNIEIQIEKLDHEIDKIHDQLEALYTQRDAL